MAHTSTSGSLETVLQTATLDGDSSITTSFTSKGPYNLNLWFLVDEDGLYLSFHPSGEREAITLSLELALSCPRPPTTASSLEFEPAIFSGPVMIENQPRGNLIVFVLYERNGEERGSPISAFMALNSKTAVLETPKFCDIHDIENVANHRRELCLVLSNRDYKFHGVLRKERRLELDLSLQSRHSIGGPTKWATTSLPALDKHNDAMQKMVTEFGEGSITRVYNDSGEVVVCTLQNSTEKSGEYNKAMSAGGLMLAVFGVLACVGNPAGGLAIGIAGLIFAAKSTFDTFREDKDGGAKNGVLYPEDLLERTPTQPNVNDIVIIRAHMNGSILKITKYFVSKAVKRQYNVKDIFTDVRGQDWFSFPFEDRHKLEIRRYLHIPGIKPADHIESSKKPPDGLPPAGSCILYHPNGELDKYYPQEIDGIDKSPTFVYGWGIMSMVQGKTLGIGMDVYNLRDDPFSPVLRIGFQKSDQLGVDRIGNRGEARNWADILRLIQMNKNYEKYWAFQHYTDLNGGNDHRAYSLYGLPPLEPTDSITRNTYGSLYFVVPPDRWTYTSTFVKENRRRR